MSAVCEARKSILLEFDSRREVEDLQRLVNDGHLQLLPVTEVWLGTTYDDEVEKYR